MDAITRIVDQLYDGALDPDAWPAAFTSICELMGASHVICMVRNDVDSSYPFIQAARVEEKSLTRFADVVPAGLDGMRPFPERRAFDYDAMMPRDQLLRSDLFHDYIRPMGGYRALLAVPYRKDDFNSFVSVCRGEQSADFDDAEIATLNEIVPHLTRALQIKLRLNAADAGLAAALGAFDQIDAGVAVVDRELRPIAINRRLEGILLRQDGLALSQRMLTADDRASARALTEMVWRAASDDRRVAVARTMLLRRPSARPPWSVTARRLDTPHAPAGAGLVVLLVEDLMRATGQIEPVLNALFGLTPREASLAAALVHGDTLADAAATLGITVGSARIYLKSIFAKTHTRRQAELVGLILRMTRFTA